MSAQANRAPAQIPVVTAPPQPQPAPKPEGGKPKRRYTWAWVLLPVALLAGGLWYWLSPAEGVARPAGRGAAVNVPTAQVTVGEVQQLLRLTGVTAPENFASLTAPTLRGNRGSGIRGVNTASISIAGVPTGATGRLSQSVASGGSTRTSSSSSGGSSGGSSMLASGGGSSVGGGGSSSMSNSMRSSLSRFSSPSSSSSSRTSSASRSSSSSTMGSGGTGSTGDSLPGGSGGPPAVGRGGGGGRGAWGMTIQSLASGGSPVRKGEVIAEFDRENMLQRLDDFEALVTVSEANLQKLRADYDTVAHAHKTLIEAARQELEKSRLDYKTAVVRSAIEAERLKLTMEEAEARLQQMQKQVRFVETSLKAQMRNAEIDMLKANNELRRARANVERMVVKAPMDGIVVLHTSWRGGEFNQIKQGDMVRPGQTIMKVVNTDSMVIEAKVSQIDVERIRIGQKATVRFDAYPDLVLSASVYSVGAIAATPGFMANYVKEVPVKLRLDKVDPRVIPDLSVSVDVLLHSEEAQAVVPRSAIFQDSDAAAPYVMVREGNAWKRRIVELGTMNFTEAAVRQGVRPGEWVATAPPPQPSGNRSSGDTGNANASAASRSS